MKLQDVEVGRQVLVEISGQVATVLEHYHGSTLVLIGHQKRDVVLSGKAVTFDRRLTETWAPSTNVEVLADLEDAV